MELNQPLPEYLNIFIGWDSREPVATEVAAHSIRRRTEVPLNISYLKHRDLRKSGLFNRPWLVSGDKGNFTDTIDGKPFSTEFSHTRFLVPALMNFQGWALFIDADMIFLSDIHKLFSLAKNKYAVMCVQHQHKTANFLTKMDDREQTFYPRKNWSSFVLWNCGHPANKVLTKEYVNFAKGSDLHQFDWLKDELIGELPFTYNYISGVSPRLPEKCGNMPDVLHYTEGGPWFDECKDVPYAGLWVAEYEHFQRNTSYITDVPTTALER